MTVNATSSLQGNKDNHSRGNVADYLSAKLADGIRQQRHVIPALVPPLRLKPILSHRYINLWSQASDWVEEAKHIVVMGYSFNNADEHFNDILRVHPIRRIDVIAPEANTDYFLHRMVKVFGTAASQYSHCKVQGLDCKQARKIRLIAARAYQVDIAKLFSEA